MSLLSSLIHTEQHCAEAHSKGTPTSGQSQDDPDQVRADQSDARSVVSGASKHSGSATVLPTLTVGFAWSVSQVIGALSALERSEETLEMKERKRDVTIIVEESVEAQLPVKTCSWSIAPL